MEIRKKCRLIYFGLLILFLLVVSSCLNYIPCRGQDYVIENITQQELINKFNKLREEYPEYTAREDHIDEYIPHYYITLYWEDLDLRIGLNIHIGNQISNPPTHLNFTLVGDKEITWAKDINSKELDKKQNEQYKEKFEKEILGKLAVEWQRKSCW